MKTLPVLCILFFGITNLYSQNSIIDTTYEHAFLLTKGAPTFSGGDANKWIAMHLDYPKQAKDSNIQGTVYVRFIIAIDGSVRNVRIMRGIPKGKLLEQEACKVIRSMPKWTPGEYNRQPVKAEMRVPINFILR